MTSLQILAIDCDYHTSCFAITTEKCRFIIEVGEGTQRLAVEHKVRLGKISALLLTSCHTCSVGGLPGMLLTLDDSDVTSPAIVAPTEASEYLLATQYFMRSLGNFHPVTTMNSREALNFEELTVIPILFNLSQNPRFPDNRLCFVGNTPIIPGKFDLQRAQELGIPKGPLFGKLKSGQAITLDNGTTITPDQVLGEATPSQYFAVICRIEAESLVSIITTSDYWNEFYQEERLGLAFLRKEFSLMIHLSHSDIVNSPSYREWMNRFGSRTKHIFSGKPSIPPPFPTFSFHASRYYNAQLHHLFGDVFLNTLPSIPVSSSFNPEVTTFTENTQFLHARPFMKFNLLPLRRQGVEPPVDYEQKQNQELQAFLTETHQMYPYLQEFQQRKALILQSQRQEREVEEEYSIFSLGTGCAIPSKYRNVSSDLIYLPSTQSGFLLDCGEGTWFQLMYLLPPTLPRGREMNSTTKAMGWSKIIKLVWISHPHADHHLGLVTFIIQRKKYLLLHSSSSSSSSSFIPLLVVAPMIVYSFLREITRLYEELEGAYLFIPVNYFDPTETCIPCLPPTVSTTSANFLPSQTPISSSAVFNQSTISSIPCNPSPIIQSSQSFAENHMGEEISTVPPDETEIDNKMPKKRQKLLVDDYLDYMTHHFHDFNSSSNESKSLFDIIDQPFSFYGIESLKNIPVIHCRQSYGLILTLRTNISLMKQKTIVYSGDTRPCDSLALYGQGADLLIHEATFEEDKSAEAISKRHSTIQEAIRIGQAMNCKALLLTHFSQRYHGAPGQLIPPDGHNTHPIQWIDEQSAINGSSSLALQPIIAFDFLQFNNLDLAWLPYLTPMIAEIFAKDDDDDDEELDEGENNDEKNKNNKKNEGANNMKGKPGKESTLAKGNLPQEKKKKGGEKEIMK